MNKVYQTIIDKDYGNCMQAVVASLLNLNLNDVPNFILKENEGTYGMYKFFRKKGYEITYVNRGRYNTQFMKKIAEFDGGINGFFYGTVSSQTFDNVSHAVVVDKELNIIHDPNPNQKALNLTPDDVDGIYVVHEMVIGKTGKLFTMKEWEETTNEEKDLNTYKVFK